jgi:hypothetical protein
VNNEIDAPQRSAPGPHQPCVSEINPITRPVWIFRRKIRITTSCSSELERLEQLERLERLEPTCKQCNTILEL